MFVIIKIPTGICNIIAGIIYAGLTYLILKMFISKIIKLPTSDFGMPKFAIKIRWILIAVLLPFVIKGIYLFLYVTTTPTTEVKKTIGASLTNKNSNPCSIVPATANSGSL